MVEEMVDDSRDGRTNEPSASEVYERLEPLEPYTTSELADRFDTSKDLVRRLLKALHGQGKVRKKETRSGPVIWIREAPKHECPTCGRAFEIKYLHPVFSSVQFCPRCGTNLAN